MVVVMLEDEEVNRRAGLIASLCDSVAFKAFMDTMLGQINARKAKLSAIIASPEDAAKHNQLVGEIDGIFTAIKYPQLIRDKLATDEVMNKMEKEG
jgi:hypothetical protein